ncbi:Penicillin-binding protein, beta-lactamase class C [Mesotoga infera]|uniref:Penicillin-binding protein, beta-lactamase class C n=1 Tax=Mesotoga infera TaxID=1236046 RepID=A0A7Z7LFD1_9BACT|nr:serine hydrolase domain-containing protein [Mesotoga infera]SSC12952.1 Penicillin-binding protein, beta-lactamase class C [Mesotoga infera]
MIEKKIESLFEDLADTGIAAAVLKDGEVVFKETFGYANLEHEIPVKANSVFHVASVSKQFTAMCIALLEEKSLDPSQRIIDFFPDLGDHAGEIKISDLIHMTNGLPDFYGMSQYIMGFRESDFITSNEAYALLKKLRWLKFKAGEKWSYGNSGYFLLGRLVERVAGLSLNEFATREIFAPLEMKDTFFREDNSRLTKNIVSGYCNYKYLHPESFKDPSNDPVKVSNALDLMECTGAGQLWSTIDDLLIWERNFHSNTLGKDPEVISKKILSPGILNDGSECNYGYGLFLSKRKGRTVVMHEGGCLGFNSVIYRMPDESLSVVILANRNDFLCNRLEKLGIEIYEAIADEILENDSTYLIQKKEVSTVESFTQDWSELMENGDKWFAERESARICRLFVEEGLLKLDMNGENVMVLSPLQGLRFKERSRAFRGEITQESGEIRLSLISDVGMKQFLPFIEPLSIDELSEYAGRYYCRDIDTGYDISVAERGLLLRNINPHHDGMNFQYRPAIKDIFYTFAPPYIACYFSVEFLRNHNNIIEAFIFRDYDKDGREYLRFLKV